MAIDNDNLSRLPTEAEYEALSFEEREELLNSIPETKAEFATALAQPDYDEFMAVAEHTTASYEPTYGAEQGNFARFGAATNYTSAVSAAPAAPTLTTSQLQTLDPLATHLTEEEMAPILADLEIFETFVELHLLQDQFVSDAGIYVPESAEEFYQILADWGLSPGVAESDDRGPVEAPVRAVAPEAKSQTVAQTGSMVTPNQRTANFREQIRTYYESALGFIRDELLSDMAGDLGTGGPISKIMTDLFAIYVQSRLQAVDPDMPAAFRGDDEPIRRALREYCGLSGDTLEAATRKTMTEFGRIFTSIVASGTRTSPRYSREDFESLRSTCPEDDGVLSDVDPWLAIRPDVRAFARNCLYGNASALAQLSALDRDIGATLRLKEQETLLAEALADLNEMQSPADVTDFIADFEGDKDSREFLYQLADIDPMLTAEAERQLSLRGRDYGPWGSQEYGPPLTKPAGAAQNDWDMALAVARRRGEIAAGQALKHVGMIASSVAPGVAVAAGVVNPLLGIPIGLGLAALFSGMDVYETRRRRDAVIAGSSAGRHNDVPLSSAEFDELVNYEANAAEISAVVNVGLAAFGVYRGAKVAAVEMSAARRAFLNARWSAQDGFISAMLEDRNAQAYLVKRDVVAGGDGQSASSVREVIVQTAISTLIGVGTHAVTSAFQRVPQGGKNRIIYDAPDGRRIDVTDQKITLVRNQDTGEERVFLEDGTEITAAFKKSVSEMPDVNLKAAHIPAPDGVDETSLQLAFKRARQTGRELSVFRDAANNRVIIKDGNKDSTASVLREIPGLGKITGAYFSAHFHPGRPLPSPADLQIFFERALRAPGQAQKHVIYGFDARGEPASVVLEIAYRNGHFERTIQGSENIPRESLDFIAHVADLLAGKVIAGKVDTTRWADQPARKWDFEKIIDDLPYFQKFIAPEDFADFIALAGKLYLQDDLSPTEMGRWRSYMNPSLQRDLRINQARTDGLIGRFQQGAAAARQKLQRSLPTNETDFQKSLRQNFDLPELPPRPPANASKQQLAAFRKAEALQENFKNITLKSCREVLAALSGPELVGLNAIREAFGDNVFFNLLANPRLYSADRDRFVMFREIGRTLNLFCDENGRIGSEYHAELTRYFEWNGKNSFAGFRPDDLIASDSGYVYRDMWGFVVEFALLSRLKFSLDNPRALILSDRGTFHHKQGEIFEIDGLYGTGATVYEVKNVYSPRGERGKSLRFEDIGHRFSGLETKLGVLKNNPDKLNVLDYEFITYGRGISNEVLQGIAQRIRDQGIGEDQSVAIRCYGFENGVFSLVQSVTINAKGSITKSSP